MSAHPQSPIVWCCPFCQRSFNVGCCPEHQPPEPYTDLIRMWNLGLACGYPKCCVAEFVMDVAAGRLPAKLRGTTGPQGWVPCETCKNLLKREETHSPEAYTPEPQNVNGRATLPRPRPGPQGDDRSVDAAQSRR